MLNLKQTPIAIALVLAANVVLAQDSSEIRLLNPQALYPAVIPELGVLLPRPRNEPDVVVLTAGSHYYKQALTSTKPQITSSEKFKGLKGARTYIVVPANRSVLVNVAFSAESRCSELSSNTGNWCEVSIRVGNKEAHPKASSFPSDTYAFDSTDSGTETSSSWESHAMDRHLCVKNKSKRARKIPVQVFWKVTNFDAGAAPSFWLDDWSMTVELAKGCREKNRKF